MLARSEHLGDGLVAELRAVVIAPQVELQLGDHEEQEGEQRPGPEGLPHDARRRYEHPHEPGGHHEHRGQGSRPLIQEDDGNRDERHQRVDRSALASAREQHAEQPERSGCDHARLRYPEDGVGRGAGVEGLVPPRLVGPPHEHQGQLSGAATRGGINEVRQETEDQQGHEQDGVPRGNGPATSRARRPAHGHRQPVGGRPTQQEETDERRRQREVLLVDAHADPVAEPEVRDHRLHAGRHREPERVGREKHDPSDTAIACCHDRLGDQRPHHDRVADRGGADQGS